MSCFKCDCCRNSQSKGWELLQSEIAAENAADEAWEAAEIAATPARVFALMVARAQVNAARREAQALTRAARVARGLAKSQDDAWESNAWKRRMGWES